MSDSGSEIVFEKRQFVRTNRGKYITEKTEDQEEADNDFWGQDLLKEEENDEQYQTEEEPEDIVDSDFDKSENDNAEDGQGAEQAEVKEKKVVNKKKSQKYLETIPGMKKAIALLRKKKKAEKEKQERQKQQEAEDIEEEQVEEDEESDFEDDIRNQSSNKGKKRSRKSSSSKYLSIAEIERLEELEHTRSKKQKKRKSLVSKKMSIRQVMREAANTEWDNLASLEQLMAREEEVKKKAVVERKEAEGPVIRWKSSKSDGVEKTTISMINCVEIPKQFQSQTGQQTPTRHFCAVSQQPAKYLDPITKTPYATLEAYRILYPEFHKEQRQILKRGNFVKQNNYSQHDYNDLHELDTLANFYLQC